MKVLLVEPGSGGHREIILSYVQDRLERFGWGFEVCRESPMPSRRELERHALRSGCSLIHFLTIDGAGKRLLSSALAFQGVGARVPLVATYYLYSNLYNWPMSVAWAGVSEAFGIRRFLVSDDYLSDRNISRWWKNKICFLPDPWCPAEFTVTDRLVSKSRLALDAWPVRLLLFGDLSRRKGLDLILKAFRRAALPNLRLTLAGGEPKGGFHPEDAAIIEELRAKGVIDLRLARVPEEAVADYFCASDFVLCCYPKWFGVSSGTFTRACAAGRPVITASHGVLARLVAENGVGRIYRTEDEASLAQVFRECVDDSGAPNLAGYQAGAAQRIAEARTLPRFGEALKRAYLSALAEAKGEAGVCI